MADVVVFGTVAADVVLRIEALPRPGDHVHAEHAGWRLGGSSANIACSLAAAGHTVTLVGPVGNDEMARQLIAELARRGVETGRLAPVEAPAPRALLLIDRDGERAIVGVESGFAAAAFPFAVGVDPGAAHCAFVESYARYPISPPAPSTRTLLVATPPEPGTAAWPADVIVGSERHFPAAILDQPWRALRRIAGSRLRWVVVTHGEAGATAFGPDGSRHVPARPAVQVDATGAGDAFAAGLMCGLLAGDDIERALELGAQHGAAAVERLQSVPPDWIDLAGPA